MPGTSGPGARNLTTGLATAYLDSSPVVAITGQVSTSLLGRDGFQEADMHGVSMPITKHNYLVTDVASCHRCSGAFYIARTGRPGPFWLTSARMLSRRKSKSITRRPSACLAINRPLRAADPVSVERAAHLLNLAERPMIIAGHGAIIARAEAELRQLVEKANIPVSTSLLGVGAIPQTHPLSVGWGGMHGEAYTNYGFARDGRVAGGWSQA